MSFLHIYFKGIKDISNKNTSQLFYKSFISDWKGLTKSGRNILSSIGNLGLCNETYRRIKKKKIIQEKIDRNIFISDKIVVTWWDNYNKTWGQPFYSISKG